MNEVVKFSERLPTVRKEEQTFRDARNLLARFQRAQQESFRSEKPYEECLLAVIDEIIPASENVLAQFTELNRGATKREIANHLALLVKCFHGGKDSSAEVFGRMLCEDVAAQQPSIGALEAACRALRRTSRFIPTISEVLEAVETARPPSARPASLWLHSPGSANGSSSRLLAIATPAQLGTGKPRTRRTQGIRHLGRPRIRQPVMTPKPKRAPRYFRGWIDLLDHAARCSANGRCKVKINFVR